MSAHMNAILILNFVVAKEQKKNREKIVRDDELSR